MEQNTQNLPSRIYDGENPGNQRGIAMSGKRIVLGKKAQAFVKKVKPAFKPARITLFGSRAKGTAWACSDYEFITVSGAFEEKHWLDLISGMVRHWNSNRPIDVLPCTKKEFAKSTASSTIREALKHGAEV